MAKLRHKIRFQGVTAPKRLRVLGLTVVVLLGALAGYFTTYISNQREYYTHRNFRELESLSTQLNSRMRVLVEVFRNAATKTAREWPNTKFEDELKFVPIGFQHANAVAADRKELASLSLEERQKITPQHIKTVTDVIEADGRWWLQLTGRYGDLTFTANTDLSQIVVPLVNANPALDPGTAEDFPFDQILIARADDSGVVIYQASTSGVNPNLNIVSLKDVPFLDSSSNKVDHKLLGSATSQATAQVGGIDYKFYLQPLANPWPAAPDDKGGTTSHWVVCGMVEAGHFRNLTWAVSYTVLITLAFICSMVALSWPVLRLLFLGPKDRLRLADLYLLGLCLLLGSAVITLFLLWGYTYSSHQSDLDRKLEAVAQSIALGLEHEVSDVVDQLRTSDEELNRALSSTKPNPNHLVRAGILDDGKKEWKTIQDAKYRYFNTLFWMDSDENQEALWTINSMPANLHPVSDRAYFNRIVNRQNLYVKDKPFWLEQIKSRATGAKTAIISTVSKYDDGEGVVAVDTNLLSVMNALLPAGFGYRIINDKGDVLFHSAECNHWLENFFDETDRNETLQSWVRQRLGGNLDASFSGEEHHLFVKPLDVFPNWTLIVLRKKQPLRMLYLETVTLTGFLFLCYALLLFVIFSAVYVVRVNARSRTEWLWPAAEFSHLYTEFLFINLALALLLVAEIQFVDGAWLVVSVFLTALAGVANLVFRRRLSIARYIAERFQLAKQVDFAQIYIVNMVLVLCITGILPAVAFFKVTYNKGMKLFNLQEQMSIAAGLMKRDERIKSMYAARRSDNHPGTFRKGHEKEAESFVAKRREDTRDIYLLGEQKIIFGDTLSGKKLAETAAEREMKTVSLNTSEILDNMPDQWMSAARALSGSAVPDSRLEAIRAAFREGLAGFMRRLPFFREFVQSRMFNQPRAQDGSWAFTSNKNGYLLRFGKLGDPNLFFVGTSPLRPFESGPRSLSPSFFVSVLIFLSIPVFLYFLVRFAAGRFFLTDLANRRSLRPIPQNEFLRTDQNLFVILSSPLVEKDLAPCNGSVLRINLRKEVKDQQWLDSFREKLKTQKLPRKVVLDYFEARIGDEASGLLKIELLEELLAAKKSIVITSTADPMSYSVFRTPKTDEPLEEAQDFADRWANVSARFLQVYLVESGNSKAFNAMLDKYQAEDAPRKVKKNLADLLDLVREECEPRGSLQKIGKEIVRQPGFMYMDPGEVFKQISNQARLYYQRIWNTCSEGEKLTLTHLAQDRYLSRKDPDLRVLLRKGLIVRAPDLRLMNLTFKYFLLTQCSQASLVTLEDQAKRFSAWETLKVPLLVGFVGMILFLVLTQKEFYSHSLTIITAITTGIPALFKLLSIFQVDAPQKALSTAATQLMK